jgi:AMP deaminase
VVLQVDGVSKSPCAENAVHKAAADKSHMIRTHSIAGDLHHDPVAADILRKEPEQETYVKLNVTPLGTSSISIMSQFIPL